MNIIFPKHEIMFVPDEILRRIEFAGRTCYKSEDRIDDRSAKGFVARILASGHHSVIEHINVTVKFVCDRGVTHELVRHRLASYSQESTRYADYSKDKFKHEITVIKPVFWDEGSPQYKLWLSSVKQSERTYMQLLESGASPEQARSVLPNSLKTEIVMTANIREWRHVLSLRCSPAAHPQMREIMLPLLKEFTERIPVLFDDIYETYRNVIETGTVE